MGGNSFGKVFRLTTYGESHGHSVGAVVDGTPAGLDITEEYVQKELDRRRPGKTDVETPRKEADKVKILSGVFEGKTIGTPIHMRVNNKDVDSEPYEKRRSKPRPSHADLSYKIKFGHVDYRGGGRSSGRETVGRVAGGAIAKKLLSTQDIEILGHTVAAAGIKVDQPVKFEEIRKNSESNSMRCARPKTAEEMKKAVIETSKERDSTGGIVEILALNVPGGIGEPVFQKLDSEIAKGLMSIGAVKGVEIGAGFKASNFKGSEMNDDFGLKDGKIVSSTNNAGGIIGGISTGNPIVCRISVKPTPSIGKPQKTVDLKKMKETEIRLNGRHDPNICPRIVPVAEAMVSLVIADMTIRAGRINPDRLGFFGRLNMEKSQ